jgi:hypothetical protein
VLHDTCRKGNASLETIRLVVERWQVACLLLDDENRTPYDMAVPLYKESFLEQATIDAACALIEMAQSPKTTTIPLLVMDYIKSTIP